MPTSNQKISGCRHERLRPYLPAVIALVVGLLVSALAFVAVRRWERNSMARDLKREMEEVKVALDTSIAQHLRTLSLVRELYAGSKLVEREEFSAFLDTMLEDGGYRAVAWAPRVTAIERAAFEAEVRSGGFPGFRVHPQTDRAECFPIDSIFPYAGNADIQGYDLAADSETWMVLEQARDAEQLAVTGPCRADWQAGLPVCVLACTPIYRNGAPHATVEERRASLTGFVVGILQVQNLADSVLSTPDFGRVGYCLYDQTDPGRSEVLCRSDQLVTSPPLGQSADHQQFTMAAPASRAVLDVAGRRWLLECSPQPRPLPRGMGWVLYGGLGMSALLTLAVAGYFASVAGRSVRISRLVQEQTAELSETNARLLEEGHERQRAEHTLQQNLQRQARLSRLFGEDLPQAPDLAQRLQKITEAVVEAVEADFCRIWVTAPGDRCAAGCVHAPVAEGPHVCRQRDRCLHLLASAGRYTHVDGEVHRRVPFGCYKIGRVAAGEEPKFLTNDAQHDPRVHNHEWARQLGLVSFAGYRLSASDGRPIGVLALFARHAISPEDDNLLAGVAASTSHVVQTVRAELELRKARDELEIRVRERTAELARANRDLQVEIDGRRQAQHDLMREKDFSDTTIDSLPAIFYLFDEQGKFLRWNKSLEQATGYSAAEIARMHALDFFADQGKHTIGQTIQQVFLTGEATVEEELLSRDGRKTPHLFTGRRVARDGKRYVVGMGVDISQRKRAEEQTAIFSRRQSVVNALLRIGLEDVPLEEMLERCLDEVLSNTWLFLAPRGAIFLVEDEPRVLVLKAQRNLAEPLRTTCARVPFGSCLCGRAAASGRIEFAAAVDERHEATYPEMQPHGHYCVPIRAADGVSGLLVVYVEAGHRRSEVEEDFLESVANTIAGVVQRRRVEARLRESEERHRAITETAQDAIITVDCEGRIRLWNSAAEKIFGYTAAEAVGRCVMDIIVLPKYHEAKRKGFAEFVRTGQGPAVGKTLEVTALRKDGAEFPVELSVSAYQDREGHVSVALVRDISAREQADEALRRSEVLNRSLVEHLPQRIFIKDRNSVYVSCNANYAHDLRIEPEQIVGKDDFAFHPRELAEKYRADDQAVMTAGTLKEIEEQYQVAGEQRWIHTVKVPYHDDQGHVQGVLGIFEDITDRKRAEEELLRYAGKLEGANAALQTSNTEAEAARRRAEQAKDALAAAQRELVDASRRAGMAEIATDVLHNVGNVLNSINVSTGLIGDKLRESMISGLDKAVALMQAHADDLGTFLAQDEKGKRLPDFLAALAEHLARERTALLQELQALTANVDHVKNIVRVQQSYAGVSGAVETVALADVVEDAVRLNEAALGRRRIEVVREYAAVPPVSLEKHKLLQILVNLVRNAGYALRECERADRRLVLRIGTSAADRVQVQVSDNGVGIPRENLARIFAHGFTTRKDGHGFGLHSSALAAKALGGALTAHSDGPGAGATFTLELPVLAVPATR